ncbi:gamma-glutamylcyclotransferase [Glaciecola sp. XM2]|jgi:cation transport regulator ChaC|uniref:gamma-glutamylcyclotransferase n=1 Tax=Glaciecola sp. XM2 TaxID=1914931 RepID=UPI001BDE7728|nr:gamma-glutamylcyclotransferase [Glaciecola sp. XM2]MBT1449798.1 gamma-glutamylcyclotransferase [Glaciecola sp. XM2]
MSHDTQALNKQRQNLASYDEIWLFGYGSLIYKVDFPFIDSAPAYIEHFTRRFWQGSHDHRGTPEAPGRVATLIATPNETCFGMAYQVSEEVFEHLDHREKNGYLRHEVKIQLVNGKTKTALVYLGAPDNAAFLGDASIENIAHQIFYATGPSGANRDYVFELANALRHHQQVDEHVFAIEAALNRLA